MAREQTIYAFQHKVTGRIYVGISQNAEQRIRDHLLALRGKRHTNELMQSDYDRYGENYSFYKFETIDPLYDKAKEFEYMDKFKSYDPDYGYNHKDPHYANRKVVAPIEFEEGEPTPMGVEE